MHTVLIPLFFAFLLLGCQSETNQTSTKTVHQTDTTVHNNIRQESKQPIVTASENSFEAIPAGQYRSLNEKLKKTTKTISAKEVIKLYYPAKITNEKSYEKIDVQSEEKGGQTIVTLTHDNQSEHVSIQGHRIVMTLQQKDKHWQIVALKQQFKCWVRKNGILWGTDKCS
ncbi:hypothetical protein [Aureispira anguillae]|uniref:Uncharacterized protein n=1 Tax=Aureispira anguillae TaxID=2864201 RepID=A0A916DQA1_9BACT|nr:hypothetical protein [Aureispira anguillae]BDS11049.1 hypothetical protein AsAng_0017600 [Aureispira anguillae]